LSSKTKTWLLVGAVATLAVGVTLGILNHRDKPSQKPAAEASAPEKREIEKPDSSPSAVPAALPKQNAEQPDVEKTSGHLALHLARGTIVLETQDKLRISGEGDEFLNFEIQQGAKTMAKIPQIPQGQHVVVGYVEEDGHKIAKYVKRDDLAMVAKPPGKSAKPE